MTQAKIPGWGYSAEAILEVLLDIRDLLEGQTRIEITGKPYDAHVVPANHKK